MREFATYSNVLVLHIPQTLKNTSSDSVAKVFGCRLWVDVAQVYRAVEALSTEVVERVGREWQIRRERRRSELTHGVRVDGRQGSGRLSDKGLSGRSLCSLSSSLLRLGDIGASVLAVVDALACPGWLSWESVDNLG